MNPLEGIEPAELSERLRTSRSLAGLTQEQAAAKLRLARTTLVAIEGGTRRVRPDELVAFSRVYDVSTNHLLRPSAIHVDFVTRFRRTRAASEEGGASDDAVRLLGRLVATSTELEQLLGRPLQANYPPEYPLGRGDVDRQAEDAALSLRSQLGLGLSPIADVVSLFELELGVRIFVRPLDSAVSGVFAFSPETGAAMLINAKHPRERRAMTAVHEGGHFMVNRNEVDVFHEDENGSRREERFAVCFASSFLMPSTAVRRRFRDYCASQDAFSARHLILMSHAFHVSPEAMCRRLEGLDLLPEGTYSLLRERGFSRETVNSVLGDPPPERRSVTPPRLALLAAEAYQRELLSEGQLTEHLGLDRVEVRRWLDQLGSEEVL